MVANGEHRMIETRTESLIKANPEKPYAACIDPAALLARLSLKQLRDTSARHDVRHGSLYRGRPCLLSSISISMPRPPG
jgi:hypothetical protein